MSLLPGLNPRGGAQIAGAPLPFPALCRRQTRAAVARLSFSLPFLSLLISIILSSSADHRFYVQGRFSRIGRLPFSRSSPRLSRGVPGFESDLCDHSPLISARDNVLVNSRDAVVFRPLFPGILLVLCTAPVIFFGTVSFRPFVLVSFAVPVYLRHAW